MRIAIFTGSLATGGAERQFALLAGQLVKRGHEVLFLTMESRFDNPDYLKLLGDADHHVLQESRWPGPLRLIQLLGMWRSVRRELFQFNADVVYSSLEWPNWLAARAVSGMRNRPFCVGGIRNSSEIMSWKRRLPITLLAKRGHLDGLIANSRAGLDESHRSGVKANHEQVICNGIDSIRFRPDDLERARMRSELKVPTDSLLLGHVGRISPMKDHETLLRGFAQVLKSMPESHLVCVGDGPTARIDELKSLATKLGIDSRIQWLGHESRISSLYSALDVLVMSSRDGEGFPNVVCEAMACETPCVVTDVGEARNIVGEAGRTVSVGNPDELALGVIQVNREKELGAMARRRIEDHFSVENMVSRTEAMLQDLITSSG